MKLSQKIKFWWFRRTAGYPHHDEIRILLRRGAALSLDVVGIGLNYCMTGDLERTARDFACTRERIRQVLWKIYHRSVQHVVRDVRAAQ